ncbi:hypothetical protein [Haloarcula sediminis]|uniref:hypothetical protein n=1 Tax=Haloarcula sediminis TaxID=3111777 RepID=UPI002D76D7E0|nr:hypothetical protein [Haloarcula sp. CK38]
MEIDPNEFKENPEQSGLCMNVPNEIPLEQLFAEDFMQLYTEFVSAEAFLEASE